MCFENPKIVYIEIADRGAFSIDETGSYLNATAFAIPVKDYYLLALLNAKLTWFFWSGICTVLRGGFLRLKTQFLEKTPIPAPSVQLRRKLEQLSEELSRNYCDSANSSHLEAELNSLIFDLFDLDAEERSIVMNFATSRS